MSGKTRLRRKGQVPLIVEPHPVDYDGYPFITLIQYRDEHILAIVDNTDDKGIEAFVLDLCGPESVDEETVIAVASSWYSAAGDKYPLSFQFSRLGISEDMSKILRTYPADFVTRVIGPLPSFPMGDVKSTKRRRKKSVPTGVEIHSKVVKIR